MGKRHLVIVVAVTIALLVSVADAQQRGRGQGFARLSGAYLLAQKSVQEDLKLTPDQVVQAEEYFAKQREALNGLGKEERQEKLKELQKESQEALVKILKPDQQKRLRQISLQVAFPRSLANPEVANQINLTDDQKEKLQAMQREANEEARNLFQDGFNEENRKKLAELRKSTADKAMTMLTAEQKTKWKELTGEPFKGEVQLFFGGQGKRNKQ